MTVKGMHEWERHPWIHLSTWYDTEPHYGLARQVAPSRKVGRLHEKSEACRGDYAVGVG